MVPLAGPHLFARAHAITSCMQYEVGTDLLGDIEIRAVVAAAGERQKKEAGSGENKRVEEGGIIFGCSLRYRDKRPSRGRTNRRQS